MKKHISILTFAALLSMASISRAEPGETTTEAKVKKTTEEKGDRTDGKVEKSTEAKVKTESGSDRTDGKVEKSSETKVKTEDKVEVRR